MSRTPKAEFRRIPAVGVLLEAAERRGLLDDSPRPLVTATIRETVDATRAAIVRDPSQADDVSPESLLDEVARRLEQRKLPGIRRVVNASGIVLHTGLGRAVLPDEALEALRAEAATYCSLAMDPETGGRAFRERFVSELIRELTGAEAATMVNNNAAATLLTLAATADGREAIVSRGQLVEIGGSYRLPDVMEQSGATMVEVGTTNKTHLRDYRDAITERTGLLVRVHTSNYKIVGFASEVPLEEIVGLGREHGIPVFDDLGAGALVDLRTLGFPEEPVITDSIRAGADILTCSADKLIGGPQGGFVLGRADLVAKVRKHPLFRCVRVGKLDLIAAEATLRLFLDPETLTRRHPTLRMMTLPYEELANRAARLRDRLREVVREGVELDLVDGSSRVGSGSLPIHDLPTRLVSLRDPTTDPGELSRRLRLLPQPVVARVFREAVTLDPRTLQDGDEERLVAAIRAVAG
jgi:L-seryl-tRNA(Ser) seleniumtransferase